MKHSGNQDVAFTAVVDHVARHHKRSNAFAELRPDATPARLLGLSFEAVDDRVYESVRSGWAGIVGDAGPDLVEIALGERGR